MKLDDLIAGVDRLEDRAKHKEVLFGQERRNGEKAERQVEWRSAIRPSQR